VSEIAVTELLAEQCHHSLLCEFRPVFGNGDYDPVYESTIH
jgi:hypothetical protein